MKQLGLSQLPDATIKLKTHCFDYFAEETSTTYSIVFPFEHVARDKTRASFQVHFEFVPGERLVLVGYPFICAMKASINCE